MPAESRPRHDLRIVTPDVPVSAPALPFHEQRSATAGWTEPACRLLVAVFLLVVLETLFSVPKLTWELTVGGREGLGTVLSLALAAGAAVALWAWRDRCAALLTALGVRLARIPRRRWLAATIAIGAALRIAWVMAFPSPFVSDAWDYSQLGAQLARGEAYHSTGGYAEWPPGLPLVLAVHFLVFGVGHAAVAVANLLLFAGALLTAFALALRLAGEAAARLATLLLALWPNLVALSGVPSKEMVLAFLLPLLLLVYLQAGEAGTPGRRAALGLAAGAVLGYSTLTQPGVMLIVAIFPIFELLRRTPLLKIAGRTALLVAGMAVVIAPWTMRNQRVFHQFVLVSTNGGSVFYRANNPLATGGWIKNGERSLAGYDEITANRLGFQWGKEWVREHPGQFLRLGLRKQVLFLGDDANGVYETLKRGLDLGGPFYAGLKLLANAWWWGVWALALVAFLVHRTWHRRPEVILSLLAILYLWAIDSVFESGSRHHLPAVALLAVLAAGTAAMPRRAAAPESLLFAFRRGGACPRLLLGRAGVRPGGASPYGKGVTRPAFTRGASGGVPDG